MSTLTRNAQNIGASQLRQFNEFLENHCELLERLKKISASKALKVEPSTYRPISLDPDMPNENITWFQLINSDDKLLVKLISTFCELTSEVNRLIDESKSLLLDFMYQDDACENLSKSQIFVQISRNLELLYTILNFLQRCSGVASEIFNQMSEFVAFKEQFNGHFFSATVIGSLADLLVVVATYEQIFSTCMMREHWSSFRKAVESVVVDDCRNDDMTALQIVIGELEQLFDGKLFQNLIQTLYNIKIVWEPKVDSTIATLFNVYLDELHNKIIKLDKMSQVDVQDSRDIIKFTLMSIARHNLFVIFNQKTIKMVYDINSRFFGVTLVENVLWSPEEFLEKHATTKSHTHQTFVTTASKIRLQYYESTLKCKLLNEPHALLNRLVRCIWKIEASKKEPASAKNEKDLIDDSDLVVHFIQVVGQIRHLSTAILNIHLKLNEKIYQCVVLLICRMIEFLRLVRTYFYENFHFFVNVTHKSSQHAAYQVLRNLRQVMNDFSAKSKKYFTKNIDSLTALQVAERCMYGPMTKNRLLATKIALSLTDSLNARLFTVEQIRQIQNLFANIELFANYRNIIDRLTNTSFMYWHQSILSGYVRAVLNIDRCLDTPVKRNAKEFRECACDFWQIYNLSPNIKNCLRFLTQLSGNQLENDDNDESYRKSIVNTACVNVENNLRLYVHYMNSDSMSTKDSVSLKDLRSYLVSLVKCETIQSINWHVMIKDNIECYLSEMFYKLKAVALTDGRTYGDMRCLAEKKCNLETVDDHLPTKTLDQGLDLLFVMRNLDEFITNYSYDMQNQEFFKKLGKKVETLTVGHMINALRTHGLGIVYISTHNGYQQFIHVMESVLQYFYHRNVKSRLQRDIKYVMNEHKTERYSYKKASDLLDDLQNIEQSLHIPSIYNIIVKIGNIMAYIRTIKSAIKNCEASTMMYTHNNREKLKMNDENDLIDVTRAALNNFENIKNASTDEVTYFKDYLTYFQSLPKDLYTTCLYVIMPALTIYHIEKCDRVDVNDGFVMGVAYFLISMNQVETFDELQWFDTIKRHYAIELQQIKEQMIEPNEPKLKQILLRKEQRIELHKDNFEMFNCNLRSAVTLMKTTYLN
ncbi:WASH complex subunit 4 [Pseudolycoriella hygida]|uniref:WASH complex subunit 4 n=1 Tax=Pseudolycoriella hygida TaxID=35572 RepID=A0A9Q0NFI3_9DIPT|nr:WASH complex subunit 4 [Pseudolycoriella hygida]